MRGCTVPRVRFARMTGALLFFLLVGAFTGSSAAETRCVGRPMPQDKLDALLAPIALYPDSLLAQVLVASTYPLQVVQADRFLKQNSAVGGDAPRCAREEELGRERSLAAYPCVIEMMSEKLHWNERLGNAFLDDEDRVMETVQSLRRRAEVAENLKSSVEQTVAHDKETIIVEPPRSDIVYAPDYDASVVCGPAAGRRSTTTSTTATDRTA